MRSHQLTAILAIILLIITLLCPAIQAPDGTHIYFTGDTKVYNMVDVSLGAEGYLFLVPCLFSLILLIMKRNKWQWINLIITALCSVLVFNKLYQTREDIREAIAEIPGSFLFNKYTDEALNSVHLAWGWLLPIGASILFVFSAFLAKKGAKKHLNK